MCGRYYIKQRCGDKVSAGEFADPVCKLEL